MDGGCASGESRVALHGDNRDIVARDSNEPRKVIRVAGENDGVFADGKRDDHGVDNVSAVRFAEQATGVVCGSFVQSGDLAACEESTQLSLSR